MRGSRGRDGSPGITFPMERRVKRLMDLFIGGLLYLFMGSKAAYWIGDDNNKLITRFIGGFERLVFFFLFSISDEYYLRSEKISLHSE